MDSESRLQGSLPNDRPVPVCVVQYADRDDEISLIDLWRVVVARKMLILLSVLGAVLLASAYLFLAEPLYRVEASLLPPQQRDIQALMINYDDIDLKLEHYTPDLVYEAFLKNLKSKGLRREYFDTHNLAAFYLSGKMNAGANMDHVFDRKFNQGFRVQTDEQGAEFVVISFLGKDPVFITQQLNQFIEFANARTVRQLINDVNARLQAEVKWNRYQLESKLKLAALGRQDRILNLREALYVARTLGIKSASSLPITAEKGKTAIQVNTSRSPLYMRGTKALEAEIDVLESRGSDEPFIGGFRSLQEKLRFLKSISINDGKLSAVRIDAAARTPYQAEESGEKTVFVLVVMFGLMVGVFLAFIAEFRSRARE